MIDQRPAHAVIVDDQALFRRGLRTLLEETGEFLVIAEAETVAEARHLIARAHPDITTIEVDLPDGDGLQLVRECHRTSAETACVLFDEEPSNRTQLSAVLAGAAGVLRRADDPKVVLEAVRAALEGRNLFGEHAIEELLGGLEEEAPPPRDSNLQHLTPQERRVFELVGQGLTNRCVGDELHLTEKTVKNYVSRVLAKLGMTHRTEIVILAARLDARRRGPEPLD